AQHERELATTSAGPEAHVTPVEGFPQKPHMVAVITPESPQVGDASSFSSPAPAPAPLDAPSAAGANPAAPALLTTAAAVAAPAPSNLPAKAGPVSVITASPTTSTPPAPQNESWFSNMTGWLTSMFDWIWS
ncbi:MAG: hypothetical protein ABI856_14020, partial [Nitrospira sp.]